MNANELLLWMSARREGSWRQFRSAVEELHLNSASQNEVDDGGERDEETTDENRLPLHQMLRLNLQRLGHAEFFSGAGGSEWRVAPPTLAVARYHQGWLGVVVGARSPSLIDRLYDAAPTGLELMSATGCPDSLRIIAGEQRVFLRVAEHVGMLLQNEAPVAILMSLPAVDDPSVRRRAELPFGSGWQVMQWSAATLGWKISSRDEAISSSLGLFRFTLGHQRHVLLCSRGVSFQVHSQVGKYIVLKRQRRRHGILRYDPDNGRLSVLASCRPPFLMERALILCSGLAPSYEGSTETMGVIHYSDIPGNVADIASALLRQELR